MRRWLIGVTLVTMFSLWGFQAWACDSVGPSGHVGKTLTVSPSAIEIQDFQTGDSFTFQATADQLSGVRPGDRVMITFKKEGKVLVAEEITKLR